MKVCPRFDSYLKGLWLLLTARKDNKLKNTANFQAQPALRTDIRKLNVILPELKD